MSSFLVLTLGYFYLDFLYNTFYSMRSNVIILRMKTKQNKTIFLPKSWLTVGPRFGLSLKRVKLKRR